MVIIILIIIITVSISIIIFFIFIIVIFTSIIIIGQHSQANLSNARVQLIAYSTQHKATHPLEYVRPNGRYCIVSFLRSSVTT